MQQAFVVGDVSNSKLFSKILWNVEGQLQHSLLSLASFAASFHMLLQLHIFHQFLNLQNESPRDGSPWQNHTDPCMVEFCDLKILFLTSVFNLKKKIKK